jgi:hypothetical protein
MSNLQAIADKAKMVSTSVEDCLDAMEGITSRDDPESFIDHGQIFDGQNRNDPTQLSPGGNLQEITIHGNIIAPLVDDEVGLENAPETPSYNNDFEM